jgi:uncharacterized protein (DUF952 family)
MRTDLIFHIVSKRKWRTLTSNGYYKPEELNVGGYVECYPSSDLNDILNTRFKGRKNLMILVIDVSRISNRFQEDKESGRILVEEAINIDAILDKIRIDCQEDGSFDVDVHSD